MFLLKTYESSEGSESGMTVLNLEAEAIRSLTIFLDTRAF